MLARYLDRNGVIVVHVAGVLVVVLGDVLHVIVALLAAAGGIGGVVLSKMLVPLHVGIRSQHRTADYAADNDSAIAPTCWSLRHPSIRAAQFPQKFGGLRCTGSDRRFASSCDTLPVVQARCGTEFCREVRHKQTLGDPLLM